MKKLSAFMVSLFLSTQVVVARVHEEMPEPGCCDKMRAWWDSLGSNAQLGLQLLTLLAVFYLLVRLFSCGPCSNVGASRAKVASSKSKSRPKPRPKAKPKAKSKAKPKARPKTQAKATSQPKATPKSKPKPKARKK